MIAGTRVPLIIRAPNFKNSLGQKTRLLVELIDVYPTIAALAGTAPHDQLDGIALIDVFNDPSITSIPTARRFFSLISFPPVLGLVAFFWCVKRNANCSHRQSWMRTQI